MFKVSEILNIVKNFIFLQTLLHFKVNLIQKNQFLGERKSFILRWSHIYSFNLIVYNEIRLMLLIIVSQSVLHTVTLVATTGDDKFSSRKWMISIDIDSVKYKQTCLKLNWKWQMVRLIVILMQENKTKQNDLFLPLHKF